MPEIDLGKVTTGAPDYAVNDPTAAGYIANRPCYAQEEVIRWDGSTEGLETVAIQGFTLMRISECAPTTDGLVGRDVTLTAGGASMSRVIVSEAIVEGENCRAVLINSNTPIAFVADKAGEISILNKAITVPSAGTYLIMESATQLGVTGLHTTVEVVKKLDAKYLPDGAGGGGNFVVVTAADASNFDPNKFRPGDVVLVLAG